MLVIKPEILSNFFHGNTGASGYWKSIRGQSILKLNSYPTRSMNYQNGFLTLSYDSRAHLLRRDRSCVQSVDIPAVVNLAQIVKVPERQRIEVLDLRISLKRQGEDILDRI